MTEYYVWLMETLGAGNIRVKKALMHFGNAENIFKASPNERIYSGIFTERELYRLGKAEIESAVKTISDCKKYGIELVTPEDDAYPSCLFDIDAPPAVLYVKGKMPDFDSMPSICIVGPRKVSKYGEKAAYSLSGRLAKAGMIIVSGGAVGSDYYAHSGALKAGGVTALVMGCGIEADYLPENRVLRRHVAENGCLISEYPPKTSTTRYSFPVRNRIMSALCRAVVVIEAGEKSGALNTAAHAAEQGKEVFVIPGSPSAKEYSGSNALLRDGAKPLLDVSDIFNEYIPYYPDKLDIKKAYDNSDKKTETEKIHKKLSTEALSKEAKTVYNYLDKHRFYPEELSKTGLDSSQILSALTELEIELLIRSLPGGCYELIENK